ncbi:MAG: zinc finger domain-containing protein [Candidatus Woesearchaeota archaeon]
MTEKTCISCKKRVVNKVGSVTIKCPKCNKYELVRCENCRANGTKYTCPNCDFVGPN